MDDMDRLIKEVRQDPYVAVAQHMYSDAWALGYIAAAKDAERHIPSDSKAARVLRESSHSDLRNRAMNELFQLRQEAEIRMMLALGELHKKPFGA